MLNFNRFLVLAITMLSLGSVELSYAAGCFGGSCGIRRAPQRVKSASARKPVKVSSPCKGGVCPIKAETVKVVKPIKNAKKKAFTAVALKKAKHVKKTRKVSKNTKKSSFSGAVKNKYCKSGTCSR